MINSLGDINGDNISDFLVLDYQNWQLEINTFVIVEPTQLSIRSLSPSLSPSSFSPTISIKPTTTEVPSSSPNSSPPTASFHPTFRPSSLSPTLRLPSRSPTLRPTFKKVSIHPSPLPSLLPSISPSLSPSNSLSPTLKRTNIPSSISPTYDELISINKTGVYHSGSYRTHFYIDCSTVDGQIEILRRGEINVIRLKPSNSSKLCWISLNYFNLSSDVIDLRAFPQLKSLNDLSYSITNSIQIPLGRNQILEFLSLSSFQFSRKNFLFKSVFTSSSDSTSSQSSSSKLNYFGVLDLPVLTVLSVAVFLTFLSFCCTCLISRQKDDEKAINVVINRVDEKRNDPEESNVSQPIFSSSRGSAENVVNDKENEDNSSDEEDEDDDGQFRLEENRSDENSPLSPRTFLSSSFSFASFFSAKGRYEESSSSSSAPVGTISQKFSSSSSSSSSHDSNSDYDDEEETAPEIDNEEDFSYLNSSFHSSLTFVDLV